MEYAKLVELYGALEAERGRLKKTELLAALLADTPLALLPDVTLLAQGLVLPPWDEREIGIAEQSVRKIVAQVSGLAESTVQERFAKLGDYGKVLEAERTQRTLGRRVLTVEKVMGNLRKAAEVSGAGAQGRKARLVAELLAQATPAEAKYVVRTVLGQLRAGVAEGVVRDAIVKAFFDDVVWGARVAEVLELKGQKVWVERGLLGQLRAKKQVAAFEKHNTVVEKDLDKLKAEELWKHAGGPERLIASDGRGPLLKQELTDAVEWAWFLRPDYGAVAAIAKERGLAGLRKARVELGRPLYVLLAEKAPSLKEALAGFPRAAVEWKYDGMRCIMEKKGGKVWLFTRRLENVTRQFPDIAALVRTAVRCTDCIIEGEVLALTAKGGPRPFQDLSQRIKRKHGIAGMAKELPVQVNVFDAILVDGEELFDKTLEQRRAALEKIVKEVPGKFQLAKQLRAPSEAAAERFYAEALAAKQEGVMVKNLDSLYQPGRRAGYWLKVKPTMETLDLAIIGATWGTGKRTGWLGSFVLGCRGEDGFRACGMIGTGVKEKAEASGKEEQAGPRSGDRGREGVTFEELTKLLKPHITEEKGNMVAITPKVIVEVAYEEIQKSPTYGSGYALRFPRLRLLRVDKGPHDADSLERVAELYMQQFAKR